MEGGHSNFTMRPMCYFRPRAIFVILAARYSRAVRTGALAPWKAGTTTFIRGTPVHYAARPRRGGGGAGGRGMGAIAVRSRQPAQDIMET